MMNATDELLEIFLSKYNRCPIPGIGTLELVNTPANASLADRTIQAPVTAIKLNSNVADTDELVTFISKRKGLGNDEANQELISFAKELKTLTGPEERTLPNLGSFFINSDGSIEFRSSSIFQSQPPVPAEWVIHPAASHNMKVGDMETNSVAMAARLRDRDIKVRSYWWIAALLVFLTAGSLIGYYYKNPRQLGIGANSGKITLKPITSTYTTSP